MTTNKHLPNAEDIEDFCVHVTIYIVVIADAKKTPLFF